HLAVVQQRSSNGEGAFLHGERRPAGLHRLQRHAKPRAARHPWSASVSRKRGPAWRRHSAGHSQELPCQGRCRQVAGAERQPLAGKQRGQVPADDRAAQGQGAVDRRAARPQQERRPPRSDPRRQTSGGALTAGRGALIAEPPLGIQHPASAPRTVSRRCLSVSNLNSLISSLIGPGVSFSEAGATSIYDVFFGANVPSRESNKSLLNV
ncbi:hypothetical protein T484DRAFT_2018581, partial [Baffinella frigidus]